MLYRKLAARSQGSLPQRGLRNTQRKHGPMTSLADDLEKRLVELEIKASLADDLLDQLNHTVFLQQQQIERLLREVADLRRQAQENRPGPSGNLQDEIPPHY